MNFEYEIIFLIVTGDLFTFRERYQNQFSTKDTILIGAEGSKRFIVTWDERTFMSLMDDEAAAKIRFAIKEVTKLTDDPRPNKDIRFRVVNGGGQSPSLIDQIIDQKIGRIMNIIVAAGGYRTDGD